MNNTPSIPLREIATPIQRSVEVISGNSYRTLGVKWWGEGAYERDTIDGSQTAATSLNEVRENDLIINKIWVRHGSVAIAGPELDRCVGSNEFPTFTLNQKIVLPRWIHWYTKTRELWNKCDALSQGTSGKNRIRPERFLEIDIPLPPLSEQRQIVDKIEELAAKIREAHHNRQASVPEIEALLPASCNALIGTCPNDDWVPLQQSIVDIKNGWSPACEPRHAEGDEWGVLKVGAVSFGQFDANENKALPRTLRPKPEYEIKCGDFLMSRANTTELVGACAVVHETPPRLLLCDKIFRFVFFADSPIQPAFLDHVLKSPALREQIERGATGTSPTMKNISKAKILALRIPQIGLPEQHRIVTYLDDLQAKIDSLKALQTQSAAELDALLPSILDRAFKGEL
jgi:type I restriction enzyme S subunit